MTKIYDQFGRKRDIEHINAVVHLEKLKEKSGSDPWPVIEECFKVWHKTNPSQYKSHLIYIDDIRETRKDRKHASTKDPHTGGILRYTLDIPQKVMFMIRLLYTTEELPMDRPFYLEFAKRFPNYKVAEKL